MDALLDQIPDETGSTVITVKAENMPTPAPNGQKSGKNSPVYDPGLVYLLEFCTVLALRDEQTVEHLGKRVVEALQTILRDVPSYHPIVVSRATFYLFKLLQFSYVSAMPPESCTSLAANKRKNFDYIRVPVLLHSVSSFSPDALSKTSSLVLQGLKCCIEQPGPLRNEIMTSPDFWVILKALATNGEAAPVVFDILESGVSGTPPAIMADNYVAAIALLNEFAALASVGAAAEQRGDKKQQRKGRPAKHEKPRLVLSYLDLPDRDMKTDTIRSENAAVARGVKAVNIIYDLTSRIPQLMEQSHLESNEEGQFRCCSFPFPTQAFGMNIANHCLPRIAWSAYWLPVFEALTVQCTNPCREVRHLAFASLQRSLLSPELTSSDHKGWTAIFGEVLFPLIKRLLKPEVFSSDRDGMSETRVQAASLLCKVFLQYLVLLSEWDGMLELWLEIIEIMDRLMNSGQGDSLVSSLRTPSRLRLQIVRLTVMCTV